MVAKVCYVIWIFQYKRGNPQKYFYEGISVIYELACIKQKDYARGMQYLAARTSVQDSREAESGNWQSALLRY